MPDGATATLPNDDVAPAAADGASAAGKQKKREIKGGLPYTVYPNAFKKALDGIITAERPDKLSNDFLTTVLKVTGGSSRPIGPLLKKMHSLHRMAHRLTFIQNSSPSRLAGKLLSMDCVTLSQNFLGEMSLSIGLMPRGLKI